MKAGWRVRRFADGSAIVAVRVRRAFFPLDGDGEVRLIATAARCGGAVWAGTVLLGSPHPSPLWLAGGSVAWCVAAWRAEPDEDEQQAEADGEQSGGTVTYTPTAEHLRELIGDRNGVLLSELLAAWQKHGWVGQIPAAELGRQLVAHGIPVRASLKVAGAVGPGVHRDDLPASAEPLPAAALADAG